MSNARFSITPSSAAEDKSLSDSVFRTLACLGVYGDKSGWCWPALQTIANMRGVSKPRVSADIKILIDKGYVQKQERFEQNTQITNMYRILFDTPLTPEVNPPLTPEINPPLTPEVNQNAPLNAIKDNDENIFKLWEQVIGTLAPTLIIDDLTAAQNEYPLDWIKDAFKIAVENNSRNWRYISTILKNWQAKGRDWQPTGKRNTPAALLSRPTPPPPEVPAGTKPPPEFYAIKERIHQAAKAEKENYYAVS